MPKPPFKTASPDPGKPTGTVALYQEPWKSGEAGPKVAPEYAHDEENQEAYDWQHISPKVMAVRQLFVLEFVKDFSPLNAMLRLGWKTDHPAQLGNNWLREPYTQYVLDKFIREAKDEALVTRATIIAGLVREANTYGLDGSGASRTGALRSLAKILGMELQKVQVETVSPGVMFIPMMGSPDQWEQMAAKAQEDLKKHSAA